MVNEGILLGRVGKIETKSTSNGLKVSNVSVVTQKKYTKDGQKEEKTTWHNVTMFSKLAEIAEKYVHPGDIIYVRGEMDNKKYVDQTGMERTRAFVIAHEFTMMPKNKEYKSEDKPNTYQENFDDNEVPW